MRKHRSDSTRAGVESFQQPAVNLPANIVLRKQDVPFFNSIIAARDEWQARELDTAAQLARAKADIEVLQKELEREGFVLGKKRNPKFALVDMLTRRVMSLSRLLQVHARATRGEARAVAKRKLAPSTSSLLPRVTPTK